MIIGKTIFGLASEYQTSLLAYGLMLKIKKYYCEIRLFILTLRSNGNFSNTHR